MAANRLVDATIPAMSAATAEGKALPSLLRRFLGHPLTKEQEQAFKESINRVGILRKEFAEVARHEMGEDVADLFAGIEHSDVATNSPSRPGTMNSR